jgi:hypothetical protein
VRHYYPLPSRKPKRDLSLSVLLDYQQGPRHFLDDRLGLKGILVDLVHSHVEGQNVLGRHFAHHAVVVLIDVGVFVDGRVVQLA